MKNLLIMLIGSIILLGCGSGSTNSQINSTSNSTDYGTLESYAPAALYATDSLTQSLTDKLCPENTTATDCENNQKHLADNYGFNLSQVTSITDLVSSYNITYNVPGVLKENRSVSGGVLIPNLSLNQIKGIVLYFHPTEVAKFLVPSCFKHNPTLPDYCHGHTSEYGEELGSILASQGYIVVMPDYIGQGIDNQVMHPYVLYPATNALSGLYMLNATNSLLDKLKDLGYTKNHPFNLYIGGFSEGAPYALWASMLLQTTNKDLLKKNQLTLKRTVGISGAYDLANAQLPMEVDNIKAEDKNPYDILETTTAGTAKPTLISYVLSSYGFYNLSQNYTSLMRPEFFNCGIGVCVFQDKTYSNIADLFNTADLIDQTIIPQYLVGVAATTGYLVNGNNSAKALIQESILDDPNFKQILAATKITSWNKNSPLSLIYLNKDSIVTNLNSKHEYDLIKNMTNDEVVKAINLDNSLYYYHDNIDNNNKPIDHQPASPFLLIAALAELNHTK